MEHINQTWLLKQSGMPTACEGTKRLAITVTILRKLECCQKFSIFPSGVASRIADVQHNRSFYPCRCPSLPVVYIQPLRYIHRKTERGKYSHVRSAFCQQNIDASVRVCTRPGQCLTRWTLSFWKWKAMTLFFARCETPLESSGCLSFADVASSEN